MPIQFPSVYICNPPNSYCTGNNTFTLAAGTERSSGANSLNQDILEVTDDFTLIKGNHTLTIGTHNEFFKFENLFIQDVYGTYFFNNIADLQRGDARPLPGPVRERQPTRAGRPSSTPSSGASTRATSGGSATPSR